MKKLFYVKNSARSPLRYSGLCRSRSNTCLRETALFFKIMLSERRQERVHDFGKCF